MKAKVLINIIVLILIGGIIIMGIFHDAVKVHGEKGLATEWNADHKIQGDVDFRHYAALNMLIESRNDWPAGPSLGRVIWRSDLNAGYIWNGTSWTRYGMKTNIWSCSGMNFIPMNPSTKSVEYWSIMVNPAENDVMLGAEVQLPDGAIVTSVVVYGSEADESWQLWQKEVDDAVSLLMAGAALNVVDNTINAATIDNSKYAYLLRTSTLDAYDEIFGAVITYIL